MKQYVLATLPLLLDCTKAQNFYEEGPQSCDANSGCAALGLADDCCPTNLAGIFLDCCDDPAPSCDANPGCKGLVDDCCPTADGTFLYCCFDHSDPDSYGYRFDSHIFASKDDSMNRMDYWLSTGKGRIPPVKDYSFSYEYARDSNALYDLIYLQGPVTDVGAYLTGEKKFSLNILETTAPACTQVILQFDNVDLSLPDNYPRGRHSRYLATISPGQEWIEFDFLDRPDESVLDSKVDSIALMFAPGTLSDDTFVFRDLNSKVRCGEGEGGCEPSPTKSCPAKYLELEGRFASRPAEYDEELDLVLVDVDANEEDEDTVVASAIMNTTDEEYAHYDVAILNDTTTVEVESKCGACSNPSCIGGSGTCSVVTSYMALAPDPNMARRATSGGSRSAGCALFGLLITGLYSSFLF